MSVARLMQMGAAGGGAGGWDLSTAVYNGSPVDWFNIVNQEVAAEGLFFKSDGTKLYIIGANSDSVHEYDLSTAWDITSASYLQSYSVATREATPRALSFKPDGLNMYIIGSTEDKIFVYDLSTAWDISSAVYSYNLDVSGRETNPTGLFFKPDGTKMYITGLQGDDVTEYDLNTAWNLATASYVRAYSVATQDTVPEDVFFKPDGSKMYIAGNGSNSILEYSLSNPWAINSASYVQSFSVSSQEGNPNGVFFKDDGSQMYIVGNNSNLVHKYDLSTAWDISTASFTYPTTDYFSVNTQESNPRGVSFKPDGTKMYVIGSISDAVNEYDLSTSWDITTASYLQQFSIRSQDGVSEGIFFKPDGTKMYMVGSISDSIHEYNLSTAWDVTSASYLQSFSVSSQDTAPSGLFFKPDGTKMYLMGDSTTAVIEYTLSTAWDITTASYLQNFSTSAQDISPTGLFFKPDGSKMYIAGLSGDSIYEYDLSTPWDVSSSSYLQSFNVYSEESAPRAIFFKPNGTKMFTVGSVFDAVFSYDIG